LLVSEGLSFLNSLVDTIDLVVGFLKGSNSGFEELLGLGDGFSVLDSSGFVVSNLLGQKWDLSVASLSNSGVVGILSGLLGVEVDNEFVEEVLEFTNIIAGS